MNTENFHPTTDVEIGNWKISYEYGILASPDSKVVILEPRLCKLMYLLSQKANGLVSRDYLVKNIWTETIVNEESLTRAIADLRKVLEKNFKSGVKIDTIPKRGYKLTIPPSSKMPIYSLKSISPLRYAFFGFLLICTFLWLSGLLEFHVVDGPR